MKLGAQSLLILASSLTACGGKAKAPAPAPSASATPAPATPAAAATAKPASLGVPASRLAPTTRGELDASGSDEAGWERDRRVDLQLVN